MHCRFAPEALPLESTPVENLFILEYMPNADGTQLRVYLYGLMLCRYPAFDMQTLGQTLSLTDEEALAAFAYWQREGLVRILCANPLEVEYVAPSARQNGPMLLPGKYGTLIQAVQSLLAPRTLRPAELRRVYDWVEVFGLSEEAVLELVSHCKERKGDRVSLNYIESVARAWADAGIHTGADAKAHADAFQALTGGAASILARWNMSRKPTQDELDIYRKWTVEWKFSNEAILAACPTLTKAERPSFKYLDSVLSRLREGGATTQAQIAQRLTTEEDAASFAREVFTLLGMGRGARPAEQEQLQAFVKDGLSPDIVRFAANQSQTKEKPFGFLKKILSDFAAHSIQSVSEAQEYIERRGSQTYTRDAKPVPKSLQYPQRMVSQDEIAHIFVNLDEEA